MESFFLSMLVFVSYAAETLVKDDALLWMGNGLGCSLIV